MKSSLASLLEASHGFYSILTLYCTMAKNATAGKLSEALARNELSHSTSHILLCSHQADIAADSFDWLSIVAFSEGWIFWMFLNCTNAMAALCIAKLLILSSQDPLH